MPAGLLRTTHAQHTALLPTPARRRWFAVLVIVVLAAPALVSASVVDVLNQAALAVMVAISLNLLTGLAGQISLGAAALLAVGAYGAGIAAVQWDLPMLAAVLVAAVAGGLVGLLVGLPSLRLRGLYLVLATLALHFIVVTAGGQYQFVARLNTGIVLPVPGFGSFRLVQAEHWYYVLVLVVSLFGLVAANLRRSRVGRAWMAIRDRDIAASSIGVNVSAYKLWAFVVSSVLNAVAGAFYAYYVGVVTVEAFSLFLAIQYVAMIIIGGLGSVVVGSVMGALVVTLVPEVTEFLTRTLPLPDALSGNLFPLNLVVFGLLMIGFLVLEPRGVVAIWARVRDYVVLWPFRYRPLRGRR